MPGNTCDFKNFKDCHALMRLVLSDEHFRDFQSTKTNEEKLLFIHRLEECPMFPIKVQKNVGKNMENAKNFKEKGNGYFQKENYNEACWFYSQAILKCPQDTGDHVRELSVYYANRSAALYHMREYDLSLGDIEIALKHHYPKELIYKLQDRKARCYLAVKKYKLALEAFQKTVQTLDDSNLSMEKKQKWQTDIQIMITVLLKECGNAEKKNSAERGVSNNKKSADVATKEDRKIRENVNPTYKAATSAVEIAYTEEMGRYAVAKTAIKAGKVILIEDPHCSVLLQKYQFRNCYHCFNKVKIVHPCPACDQVIFCCADCAESALSSYHRIECSVLGTLWASEISVTCHMALRIIMQKKLDYFLNKRKKLTGNDTIKVTNYVSSNYETVFNLVRHEERRKVEDMLNRTHVALFLLNCLKEVGYFENVEPDGVLTEEQLFIGGLILRNLQILQFNAHEVSELLVDDDTGTSSSEFIGGAVYPTLALFNHSCNPSIVRYFKGTTVVTRAIRNIKAGEMIGENYGPLFTQKRKGDRQRVLNEQYWFSCTCEACSNDWPSLSEMLVEKTVRFRCSNRKCGSPVIVNLNDDNIVIVCAKCSNKCNIIKALKLLQETDGKFKVAESFMQVEKVDKALEIFLNILNLLDENLVPPFKDYYICQQAIRTCYLIKGNRSSNKNCLKS